LAKFTMLRGHHDPKDMAHVHVLVHTIPGVEAGKKNWLSGRVVGWEATFAALGGDRANTGAKGRVGEQRHGLPGGTQPQGGSPRVPLGRARGWHHQGRAATSHCVPCLQEHPGIGLPPPFDFETSANHQSRTNHQGEGQRMFPKSRPPKSGACGDRGGRPRDQRSDQSGPCFCTHKAASQNILERANTASKPLPRRWVTTREAPRACNQLPGVSYPLWGLATQVTLICQAVPTSILKAPTKRQNWDTFSKEVAREVPWSWLTE
jgi:hypothetical protein